MEAKTYTIDAKGKSLGRITSETAKLLLGKNTTDFVKNVKPDVKVKIENAGKMNLREAKLEQKNHKRYSGYPGGFKETSLKDVLAKKGPKELIRHALHGMLPGNRLRAQMMKRVEVTD
jgi:large subunit ribosomal protein L13